MLQLSLALELVQATLKAAEAAEFKAAVVVVDTAGNVVASARADGLAFPNYNAAYRKARTSGIMGAPTHVLADFLNQDPLIAAAMAKDPDIFLLPGGLPIVVEGVPVGGLGVAGAHYSQDQAAAEAGLASIA